MSETVPGTGSAYVDGAGAFITVALPTAGGSATPGGSNCLPV